MRISVCDIVTAFQQFTIGTKVLDGEHFWECLEEGIQKHDTSLDRVPGQSLVHIPNVIPYVSGGVGRNRIDPSAYCLRKHRGVVHAYLRREFAAPVTDCHAVVYILQAYLNDPDVDESPGEKERIIRENPTHVLVTILASSGPRVTLTPYRFVKNLAGGNNEALAWSGDEIRAKAREIADYTDAWSVVAD
jgi:hypothetical protein